MQKQNKAIMYALLAILLWSTVAVPFKIGLRYFHFVHFLFITIFIAVISSFINILLQGKLNGLKSLSLKQLLWGALGGILNPFLYYLMLFKAYSILPAQLAQALNYTWPIMLVLLSVPLLGQKLKLKSILTLLIGFIGVYLIASEGNPWSLKPSEPFGVLLAISTSVIWALYWLLNAKSKVDASVNLFVNFLTGLVCSLPLLLYVPFEFPKDALAWGAVLYSGVFEMGVTFAVWLAAMRLTERTDQISNYVFISPFLSLIFIYLFLGEHIYITTIIGLVFIISSVFLETV